MSYNQRGHLLHIVFLVACLLVGCNNRAGVRHFEHGRGHYGQQLFDNLLTNAIKFVKPQQSPRIQIQYFHRSISELPEDVCPTAPVPFYHQISIRDNGIGFDLKYRNRIFQVFQQLNSRSDYPGTGVGLSICQRVVENHGGSITADSSPGQGATFCVYLPA